LTLWPACMIIWNEGWLVCRSRHSYGRRAVKGNLFLELNYVRLFFSFTLNAEVSDPYALFGCRSGFDAAFRKALSCRRLDCSGCSASAGCSYPANFGQSIASDPEAVRRHQKPPLPFVFQFPILPPSPNRGKTLQCTLTLLGSAVQQTYHYIAAVRLLLQGIPASLLRVEAESPGGGRALLAAGDQPALPLLSALDPTLSGPLPPDRATVTLLTPLKLMHEGRLLKRFNFSQFSRALMRRVSSLAYHYEGAELPLDYRWLSLRSEAIETVSSDCRFVSWGGRPAGILGTASFRGDLEPFHLFLQMGLATQLGKGASFGFGAYRISAGPS